jgi:hypothetical protein
MSFHFTYLDSRPTNDEARDPNQETQLSDYMETS